MIMRITWGKLHPGKWGEYERAYHATVMGKGRSVKGLRGRWLVQDTEDKDAGFTVSLWDSMADMRAYEQSDFYQKEILTQLQPFFVGEFKTHRCEVKLIQEVK